MAAYRAVLTQRWPNRPIRCLLVWTDGPRLMEIPPSALDQRAQGHPAVNRPFSGALFDAGRALPT